MLNVSFCSKNSLEKVGQIPGQTITSISRELVVHYFTLCDTGTSRLVVLPIRLSTVSNRAFLVVAARTWNDLPSDVTSAESLVVHVPPMTENPSVSEVTSC